MVSPSMAEAWPTVRFGTRSVAVSSLGCGFGAGRPGLEIGGNTRSADRYRGGIERRRQAHGADGSANSAASGLQSPDVALMLSPMGGLIGAGQGGGRSVCAAPGLGTPPHGKR